MSAIRTPGSIWASLIDQQAAAARKPEGRGDAFVYVVGPKGSGKTTLINRILYPNKAEPSKPSEGLEYTYARKTSALDHEKKSLAHIWELGGAAALGEAAALSDQLFLTYRQVATAVVVIVVDLSNPAAVLPSALQWLATVQRKLGSTYALFERKGLQVPEQLRARASAALFAQHPDKAVINQSGISLVLVGTKWDVARDQAPEALTALSRALRCLAHGAGAHLVYLGGLQPGGGAGAEGSSGRSGGGGGGGGQSGPPLPLLLDSFSRLLNHLMFVGLDKKIPLKTTPLTDPLGPQLVPAGADSFKGIGRPRAPLPTSGQVTAADVAAMQKEWQALVSELFPPPPPQQVARFEVDPQYREDDIDAARERKGEALAAYRKEVAAAARATAAAKKQGAAAAAAAAAVAGGGAGRSSSGGAAAAAGAPGRLAAGRAR